MEIFIKTKNPCFFKESRGFFNDWRSIPCLTIALLLSFMNFLAHLALSENDEEILIGNFIADTVRRSEFKHFKKRIIQGIDLHHFIDEYTDTHPVVKQSKKIFLPRHGKYSGVIVDIVYDHFLAVHFSRFYDPPLPTFVTHVYDILSRRSALLSKGALRILPYMIEGNWLESYATMEGMKKVFNGMSRRARFSNNMAEAPQDLSAHYQKLEAHFLSFFPELKTAAEVKLRTMSLGT